MEKSIQTSQLSPVKNLASAWSTFWAMVRKELILMVRYPVNFVASFGQVFLIVAIFTLGSKTFSVNLNDPSSSSAGTGSPSGLVIYGFILFMFVSDTLWTIGYNVRHEQVQGTLEQLYLSPASKFAGSHIHRVMFGHRRSQLRGRILATLPGIEPGLPP